MTGKEGTTWRSQRRMVYDEPTMSHITISLDHSMSLPLWVLLSFDYPTNLFTILFVEPRSNLSLEEDLPPLTPESSTSEQPNHIDNRGDCSYLWQLSSIAIQANVGRQQASNWLNQDSRDNPSAVFTMKECSNSLCWPFQCHMNRPSQANELDLCWVPIASWLMTGVTGVEQSRPLHQERQDWAGFGMFLLMDCCSSSIWFWAANWYEWQVQMSTQRSWRDKDDRSA